MKTRATTSPFTLALAAGTALALTAGAFAQPQLLKDVNPGAPSTTGSSFPNGMFQVANNLIYFAATDPINGTELWRTDGTLGGTSLIADFNPGAGSGPIEIGIGGGILVPYLHFERAPGVNRMYFFGQSPSFGYELCITDGTALGTTLIKDVAPGASFGVTGGPNGVLFGTNLSELDVSLVEINGQGYYGATNLVNGAELWTTDGTAAGSQMVVDISTSAAPTGSPAGQVTGSSSIRMITKVPGNKIMFAAVDGQTPAGGNGQFNGLEFYIYDPSQPTVYNPATGIGSPNNLIGNPKRITNLNGAGDGAYFWMKPAVVGNFLYWVGCNAGGTPDHLWRYDYTQNNPAIDQSNTSGAVSKSTQATAIGAVGATPMRVQMDPVAIGAGATQRVTFISNAGDNGGTTLWVTDPAAGQPNATRVSMLGAFPRRGQNIGGKLLYFANSGPGTVQPGYPGGQAAAPVRGWELYATDGITGIGSALANTFDNMIREYNPGEGAGIATVVPTTSTPATNAAALVFPTYMYAENGRAWFGATTIGASQPTGGIFGAANISGGASQAMNAATTSIQPHSSDATTVGSPVAAIRNMNPLDGVPTAGSNSNMFSVESLNAGVVMFSGFTTAGGRELWRSDNTAAGTTLVRDIAVIYTDSLPALFTSMPGSNGDGGSRNTKIYQNRIFFNAFSAVSGREMWTAVAVPANPLDTADSTTVQVADINAGAPSSNPGQMLPVFTTGGWRMFFSASTTPIGDTVNGSGGEVWSITVDPITGQPNAPTQVADLFPGVGYGYPVYNANNQLLTLDPVSAAIGGQYLFMGLDGNDATVTPLATGRELWITDGNPPTLVKDVNPGINPSLGFETPNTSNFWAGGEFPANFRKLSVGGIAYAAVDNITATDVAPTASLGVGEPYISDGTALGTHLLDDGSFGDFTPGDINASGGSGPIEFAEIPAGGSHPAGAVIFFANDGISGLEPWIYDRNSGVTSLLMDINGTAANVGSYSGQGFAVTGSGSNWYAVFTADDGLKGDEMYVYNATSGAVTGAFNNAAFDLNTNTGGAASSFPGPYQLLPDWLGGETAVVFDANDGASGFELYTFLPSQPYAAGVNPKRIIDLNPGISDGTGGNYGVGGDTVTGPGTMGQRLYFDGNDGLRGFEPWAYDGRGTTIGDFPVPANFEFLGDLNPGTTSSQPNSFFVDATPFAQILYFSAFKPDTTAPLAASGEEPHFFVAKCGPADVTFIGGDYPGGGTKDSYFPPDGQLSVDDIIVFFNAFSDGCGANSFLRCNPADVSGVGGPIDTSTGDLIGPDGQLTVDDIIVFINGFGDGC